jgi:hypothetical protein
LDEDYQALYAAEERVAILSRYFAGLAVLISCLGLFGLTAFTAERRIKEIRHPEGVGVVQLLDRPVIISRVHQGGVDGDRYRASRQLLRGQQLARRICFQNGT